MPTIQDFKQIRSSVSPEVQADLYRLVIQDLNWAVERIIGIVNENGISFTAEEVRSYLREMDSKDEYDDIQLDEATLAAVTGGGYVAGGADC